MTADSYDTTGDLLSQSVGKPGHFLTTAYAYDTAGRLTRKTNPDGSTIDYYYDCFGRQIEEKHTVGGAVVKDITTAYDSQDRPLTTQDQPNAQQPVVWSRSTQYPLNKTSDTTTTLAFDGLTSVLRDNPRGVEYEDDTSGTGVAVTRAVNARDNADRVTQSSIGSSVTFNQSYDGAGRLTKQWGTGWANGPSVPESQVPATYTYNIHSGLKASDSLQPNLGGTSALSYHYLNTGQLADSNAPSGGSTISNSYQPALGAVAGESLTSESSGQSTVAQLNRPGFPGGSNP